MQMMPIREKVLHPPNSLSIYIKLFIFLLFSPLSCARVATKRAATLVKCLSNKAEVFLFTVVYVVVCLFLAA